MNVSRMEEGRTVAAVGAAVLIVSIFLSWTEGGSAWSVLSVVNVLMLLVGIAGLAFAALPALGLVTAHSRGISLAVAACGLMVFGFAAGFEFEFSGDLGVWLAMLGSLAVAFGAFQASGEQAVNASARVRVPWHARSSAPVDADRSRSVD